MLLGLAYRITGCRSEAEDILHDVFIKWAQADKHTMVYPKQWLTKVTTNLAFDLLKSARVQRESYIGPWLPEPYFEHSNSPDDEMALDQSISVALMLLLEKLNPGERISFILHDLFHFSFEEIAGFVGASAVACRQQASRARSKLSQEQSRKVVTQGEHKRFTLAFFKAVKQGNVNQLRDMLKDDVVLFSDGGGKVEAAPFPIVGSNTVAQFLHRYVQPDFANVDSGISSMRLIVFNGSPGLLLSVNGIITTALQIEVVDDNIQNIYAHRNPDKLKIFELC